MVLLLLALMLCLLLRSTAAMDAASAACHLFVTAVLPGLFPYMVLSLMTVSRLSRRMSPALLMMLGWGGGSPTGARLLPLYPTLTRPQQLRLAVSCATMSPMFLLGTVGTWLDSTTAGAVVLASVILGGWVAGEMAGRLAVRATSSRPYGTQVADSTGGASPSPAAAIRTLSFGVAVEQSTRTMLLVCGTMVMLRVFAALAAEVLPAPWVLPVTTLLEVTTGAQAIAGLALPLPLRTALVAGATGVGGMASMMQNRAVYPAGFMPLGAQLLWQAVHGGLSFVIALGTMLLC